MTKYREKVTGSFDSPRTIENLFALCVWPRSACSSISLGSEDIARRLMLYLLNTVIHLYRGSLIKSRILGKTGLSYSSISNSSSIEGNDCMSRSFVSRWAPRFPRNHESGSFRSYS